MVFLRHRKSCNPSYLYYAIKRYDPGSKLSNTGSNNYKNESIDNISNLNNAHSQGIQNTHESEHHQHAGMVFGVAAN